MKTIRLSDAVCRDIIRRCLREQFGVPPTLDAGLSEDEAVDAAVELLRGGWSKIEQVRKPKRRRPGLYRLKPIPVQATRDGGGHA